MAGKGELGVTASLVQDEGPNGVEKPGTRTSSSDSPVGRLQAPWGANNCHSWDMSGIRAPMAAVSNTIRADATLPSRTVFHSVMVNDPGVAGALTLKL